MQVSANRFLLLAFITTFSFSAYSQEKADSLGAASQVMDSLRQAGYIFSGEKRHPQVMLNREEAIDYLRSMTRMREWKNPQDPLRRHLERIVWQASTPPYDSTAAYLKAYPYDSLNIPWDQFYIWEPLRFKMPVFREYSIAQKMPADSSVAGDTAFVSRIIRKTELRDTSLFVVLDTLDEVTSDRPGFPFRYLKYPYQSDSIKAAVKTLSDYLEMRDSSVVYFSGTGQTVTPVWVNSRSGQAVRYWLRNDVSDSVTVWIGNAGRDTLGLYLEKGVNFRRPARQISNVDARVNVESVDKTTLLGINKIIVKPQYWKYRSEASFVLNQAALYNWVKGGEKSISFLADIIGYADYNNKELKVTSSNFARLKLGFLKSGETPLRKNIDIIETNSKVNHKAFGKFDFSAIMLFKTQIAPGYNYSADPTPMVSKFMNPSILTLGFGLDYKPSKVTSVNFSPFSYKNTFVSDTLNIDQTKYGVAADRRSRNEVGANLIYTNEYKPLKNLTVTNRVQLFTNYVNNPLNIDIDWEMIAVMNLNWFTDIRLNTHLIYDDDTKTPVLDKDNNPVNGPDGKPYKTARPQFKEMLGFSFVFRF